VSIIYHVLELLIIPIYETVVSHTDQLFPFVPTFVIFAIGFIGIWIIFTWGTVGEILGIVLYVVALHDLLVWVNESFVRPNVTNIIMVFSFLFGVFAAVTIKLREAEGTQPASGGSEDLSKRSSVRVFITHNRRPLTVTTVIGFGVFCVIVHVGYHPRTWDRINVALKWKHQAQFAGLYVAQAKGYFRDQGIKVELLEGGPESDQDPFERVKKGNAEIGIGDAINLIYERAEGNPVKAVAVIFQRSPAVWFFRGDEKRFHASDLIGKTVAVSITERTNIDKELDLWLRKQTVKFGKQNVSLVNFVVSMKEFDFLRLNKDEREKYKGVILKIPLRRTGLDSLGHFLAGNVDVWTGYTSNELLAARRHRPKLDLVTKQSDPPIYGDILFTSDKFLNDRKEVIKRFMIAFRAGWNDALMPEKDVEVISNIMQYVGDKGQDNRLHQFQMLEDLGEKTRDQGRSFGSMAIDRWTRLLEDLKSAKLVSRNIDASTLFDSTLLQE
jgi:ABC-type nitrate/sulfonate/bicarbonate transport system substrate-binding protein